MEKKIIIKGARENNLKNIDVSLPKDSLVVFSGLAMLDSSLVISINQMLMLLKAYRQASLLIKSLFLITQEVLLVLLLKSMTI